MSMFKIIEAVKHLRKSGIIAVVLLLLTVSCSSPEHEFDLSLVFDYDYGERRAEHIDLTPDSPEIAFEGGHDWSWLYYFDRNVTHRHRSVISPFYGETLTIFVERNWAFRYSMFSIANGFERLHPGVRVELVFSDDFATSNFDALIRLMEDNPPLLFQASTIQYPFHEHSDYFADWMPVLASHPSFIEDEWNMNVLLASLINGELIAFPSFQGFRFASANRNILDLSYLFELKDSITPRELLDLYAEISSFHGSLSFFWLAMQSENILFLLNDFFDYENNVVEFYSEEFIELLELVYYSVHVCDAEIVLDLQYRVEMDMRFGYHYAFRVN